MAIAEDDPKARKAKWEEAGRPLFTRMWTYKELQEMEAKPGFARAGSRPNAHLKTPKDWPKDTQIDPKQWVLWLPEGWKQGLRTHEVSGKVLQCYFSPEGKRFWHKKDIEQVLGRSLPNGKRAPAKEKAEDASSQGRARYVTDEDAFPKWPEADWLPKDWKVGFRQTNDHLHRVVVPPNQDSGFCYHLSKAQEYIESNGTKGLTPFETSRAVPQWGGKRKSSSASVARRRYKFAKAEDYDEVRNFKVFEMPLNQSERKAAAIDNLEQHNTARQELYEALVANGFKEPTLVLVSFFKHKKGKELPPKPNIAEKMTGMWYQRPARFNDKVVYQKVGFSERLGEKKLCCSKMHIFWSKEYKCWKMGALNDDFAGFLRCDEDVERPFDTTKRWKVVKQQLCSA
eukprot:Skav202841  [mRNA]  locus=scaffold746:126270:127466:+ [translate_table: standard]